MIISVVPVGNSKGIRIPKTILNQLKIKGKLDLEVVNNEIHLKPVTEQVRNGWSEAFEKMAEYGDDNLLITDINTEDDFEWEW